MTTLKKELERLVQIRDKHTINEIKTTMENVRDDVFAIMDNKLDMALPVVKEQRELQQINYNINLIKEALKRIL